MIDQLTEGQLQWVPLVDPNDIVSNFFLDNGSSVCQWIHIFLFVASVLLQ